MYISMQNDGERRGKSGLSKSHLPDVKVKISLMHITNTFLEKKKLDMVPVAGIEEGG